MRIDKMEVAIKIARTHLFDVYLKIIGDCNEKIRRKNYSKDV